MRRARSTRRVLAAMTALALIFGAGTSRPVFAQLPTDQGQRELEGRIANVNGELIQLSDGVVVRVPQGLAPQADLREGKTVKVTAPGRPRPPLCAKAHGAHSIGRR